MAPSACPHDRTVVAVWLVVCGLFSTAWCWTAAHALGCTFDEPFYVQAGLQSWHALNHRELLRAGTMPLPAEVETLPLWVAEWFGADPRQNLAAWLPVARMSAIVFWWLLLRAAYRLASQEAGAWAGCLAVAMVACEPVLLGHAGLATTDVAFTACLLTLTAGFRARRDEPRPLHRLGVPVLWCTLTFLAKASALLFVPVCLGLVECERLWRRGWRPGRTAAAWEPVRRALRDLAVVGGLGLVLLLAVCPRAPRGLLFQVHHNLQGQGGFVLGRVSPDGFWYYFPAALGIKLGIPLLVLLGAALLLRPRRFLGGCLWAALGLLALTPTFRVQIGVRFVLPVVVLGAAGAAVALAHCWAEQAGGDRRWRRYLAGGSIAALLAWSAANAWTVWPNGLCYTNELWGGTWEGYRALHDSNFDWGQGLKDLAAWQRRHGDAPLHLAYFGTDPMLTALPIQRVEPAVLWSAAATEAANRDCYLAVSTNYCFGGAWLHGRAPCDRTLTYLIYDFRQVSPSPAGP